MVECQVSQLAMPSHPDAAKRRKILVGFMQDRVHGFQSGFSFPFVEENHPREEAAIVVHGEQLLTVLVPLCSVSINSEVVIFLEVTSMEQGLLLEVRLGAEQSARQVWMPHGTGVELNNVAEGVDGFPMNPALPFNGEVSSHPSKSERGFQTLKSPGKEVIFARGARVGASTVTDGTEGVRGSSSGSLEACIGSSDAVLDSGQVSGIKLARIQSSHGRPKLSQVLLGQLLRLQLKGGTHVGCLAKESHGQHESSFETERRRSGSDPGPPMLGQRVVFVKGVSKGRGAETSGGNNQLGDSLSPLVPGEATHTKEQVVEPAGNEEAGCQQHTHVGKAGPGGKRWRRRSRGWQGPPVVRFLWKCFIQPMQISLQTLRRN